MSDSTTTAAPSTLNMAAYIANIVLVMGIPTLFHLPDNAEMSAKYQTIVTPAGWAFAIWGVIFTLQAIWATLQLVLPNFRTNPLILEGVGYNYIAVCAVQVAWSFSFALDQIVMSMIWMSLLLYFLIRIYKEQYKVIHEFHPDDYNSNFWLLRFPFTLHLGWIVAATLVNFNVLLVAHSAGAVIQFASAILAVAIALVAGLGTLYMLRNEEGTPDVTIPLVLVWALNAISKELKDPKELIVTTFSTDEIGFIQTSTAFAAVALLVASLAILFRGLWRICSGNTAEEARLLN